MAERMPEPTSAAAYNEAVSRGMQLVKGLGRYAWLKGKGTGLGARERRIAREAYREAYQERRNMRSTSASATHAGAAFGRAEAVNQVVGA